MNTIKYIAEVTIENLFSVALNGMEGGMFGGNVIGNNNGTFNEVYVKEIVYTVMDDRDIFNEVGNTGFEYVLNDIPTLCKEYLKTIEDEELTIGEVDWIKENYPEIYTNVITSLNNIIIK